jgi:hypothetical protein
LDILNSYRCSTENCHRIGVHLSSSSSEKKNNNNNSKKNEKENNLIKYKWKCHWCHIHTEKIPVAICDVKIFGGLHKNQSVKKNR